MVQKRLHLVKDCAYTHAQVSVQRCVSTCLYKVVVRVWVCMYVSARVCVCVCVQCSDLFLQSLHQPQQKASLSWIYVYTG